MEKVNRIHRMDQYFLVGVLEENGREERMERIFETTADHFPYLMRYMNVNIQKALQTSK